MALLLFSVRGWALALPFEPLPTDPAVLVSSAGACQVRAESDALRVACADASLATRLVGARADLRPRGTTDATAVHRLVGDGNGTRTTLAWSAVEWVDAWPGVDVALHVRSAGYERRLTVGAGADPAAIALGFQGADSIVIDEDGSLTVTTSAGVWRESAPFAWQDGPRGRESVPVRWRLVDTATATFELGSWDRGRPLYIDPLIAAGGLFGPTGLEDSAYAVATGPDGTTYVVGGAHQDPGLTGGWVSEDAFVLALDPQGATRWLTWIGGTRDYQLDPTCETLAEDGTTCLRWRPHPRGLGGNDAALHVAVRGDRVAIAGTTWASDFPATGGGHPTPGLDEAPTDRSRRDAFLAVLDTTTGLVRHAGYIGGDGDDRVNGLLFAADRRIDVLGTSSSRLQWFESAVVPNGVPAGWWQIFEAPADAPDAFRGADPIGVQGSSEAQLIDAFGHATGTYLFGTLGGAPVRWQVTATGEATAAAATVDGAASIVRVVPLEDRVPGEPYYALVGVTTDRVGGFDGAPCGRSTGSACGDGPCAGGTDTFVAVYSGGSCLEIAYIGGLLNDVAFDAAYAPMPGDREGIVLVGRTASADFPVRAAMQPVFSGPLGLGIDAFVAYFDLGTGRLGLSTFLGLQPPLLVEAFTSDDVATGVAIAADRTATVVGFTRTGLGTFVRRFPFARDFVVGDNGQAFIASVPLEVADVSVSLSLAPPVVELGGRSVATVTVRNTGTIPATSIEVGLLSDEPMLDPAGSPCTGTGRDLTCRLPVSRLDDGGEYAFTVGLIAPPAEASVELVAVANAHEQDPNSDNNMARVALLVGGVDLAVSLTPTGTAQQPHVVAMDAEVPLTLEVRNNGGEATDAVVLVRATPQDLYRLSFVDFPEGCERDEGPPITLRCVFTDVARSTPRTAAFRVTQPAGDGFDPSALAEVRDAITATVAPSAPATRDANPQNDRFTTALAFRQPDLVAVPQGSAPRAVGWGQPFDLRVAVRNDGPGAPAAVGVNLGRELTYRLPLPAGCTVRGDLVQCAFEDPEGVAVGRVVSWTLPMVAPERVGDEPPRELPVPFAAVGRAPDVSMDNNYGTVVVQLGAVDVGVAAPSPTPNYRVQIVEPTQWRITNAASQPATGVSLLLGLQHAVGVELRRARVRGVDCPVQTVAGGISATCDVGTLAAGETVTAEFDVLPRGRGELRQIATVVTSETNVSEAASRTLTAEVRGPDLRASLAPGTEDPVRGRTWSARLDVANIGVGNSVRSADHPNVVVTVDGSAFATLDPPDPFCGLLGDRTSRIVCGLPLEPGQAQSYGVEVRPDRVGPLRIQAVANDWQDEDTSNGTAVVERTVRGAQIDASAGLPDRLYPDTPFDLTVDLANRGPADAAEPVVRIVWSDVGVQVGGTLPSGCSPITQGVECDISLANGDSRRLVIPLQTCCYAASETITVTVRERGDPGAPALSAQLPFKVEPPDVAVSMGPISPSSPLSSGTSFEAAVSVVNTVADAASEPVVLNVRAEQVAGASGCAAPATLDRVEISSGTGGCGGAPGGPWQCSLGRLDGGATTQLTVFGQTRCAGRARVHAELSWDDAALPDPVASNDRRHQTVEVVEPGFVVAFDPPNPEGPYTEPLAVTARVGGVGGVALPAGTVVTFTDSAGVVLSSVGTSSGTCTSGAGGRTCTLDAVPAGSTGDLALTLDARSGPASGQIAVAVRNAAGTTTSSGAFVARLRGPDLQLAALGAPATAEVGDLLVWTFSVANAGGAPADAGAVSFTIPGDRLSVVSIDGLGACRVTALGRVCDLPTGVRAIGSSATVSLTARATKPGDVAIAARVSARYVPDEDPTNDTLRLETTIEGPDLSPAIAFSPDTVAPGAPVDATVSVANTGSVASDPAAFTFTLGSRLTARSLPPGCTLSQGVARCALPSLAPGTSAPFVFGVAASAGADVSVEASVSAADDADPSNDRATGVLFVTSPDSDGDGIADAEEDAGPGGGDANGDGVPDRGQAHVAALAVPSFGALVLEAPAGATIRALTLASPPAPPPPGVAFPMGALSFEVAGVSPGGLIPLRLTFPAGVPAWAWYKYDGAWTRLDWDGTTGGRALTQRTLELVVRDGGRGDDDGFADGVVRDPGAAGLAVLTVDRSDDAPDVAPGDGACAAAGGGCTLRAALEEANAGAQPFAVHFDFDAHVEIAPTSPLPSIITPVVLDATEVPGTSLGDRGVVVSGRLLAAGPLLLVESDGVGVSGLGVRQAPGDGILVRGTGFRFAHGALGTAHGGGPPPQPWAALRADDPAVPADELIVVDSWVGSIAPEATIGIAVSAADVRIEDVVVNLNVLDGRRPQAIVPTGIHLSHAPRATLRGLAINGAQTGLLVEGDCTGTRVLGSYFGLGADGFCHAFTRSDPGPVETGEGPCLDGNSDSLVLRGARGVTVGGPDPDERNVFGNQQVALRLEAGSTENVLLNNRVGLAADGTCQAPGAEALCRLYTSVGILVDDAPGNTIGRPGAGNIVGAATVEIRGSGSSANRVESNWIGLAGDRTTPLRPGFTASAPATLYIDWGATATQVVDNTVGHVQIGGFGAETRGTVLSQNRIGVAPDGISLPAGSTYRLYDNVWSYGLVLASGAHQTRVEDNTFASQIGVCVETRAPVEDLELVGNHIGLSADGRSPLPCRLAGVRLAGAPIRTLVHDNAFGRCAEEPSATFDTGCLLVEFDAESTVISSNTFGITRQEPGGADGDPIASPAPAILLGRTARTRVEGNRIFATAIAGLYDRTGFEGDYANAEQAPVIIGNRFGVDALGVARGGVDGAGLLLAGSWATVGGDDPDDGNIVRGSGGPGIRVGNVQGVDLQGNVLSDNAGLGIAFSDGGVPVANDRLDGDGGPNGSQNHPIIGTYTADPAPRVAVSLQSAAATTYRIDVYAVTDVDASGHGEADAWLGSATVSTDAAGDGVIDVPLTRGLSAEERLTATATGPDGTSEFGPAARVTSAGVADLQAFLFEWDPLLPGSPGVLQVTGYNAGPDAAADVVLDLTLPEDWALSAPDDPFGGSCAVDGARVRCTLAALAAGESVDVLVPVTPPGPGRFVASGAVASAVSDPVVSNSAAALEVLVGAVRYLVTARPQGFVSNHLVGDAVPFEVEYFRMGPRLDLADMTLSVTLPTDARVVGGDLPCAGPGPVWTCQTGPVLGAEATRLWRIDVVFGSAGSAVPVEFALDSPNPNSGADARAIAFVNLTGGGPGGALALDVRTEPAVASAGSTVHVVATVSNGTAGVVDGLGLQASLPAGAVFAGADASCAQQADGVWCVLPPVDAGAAGVATLRLSAPSDAGEVRVCVIATDTDTALPECASVVIGGGGYDAAITVAPAGVAALAGERLTLRATVSAPTGAPASVVRWRSTGPASARGPDCVLADEAWACAVPALGAGATANVELAVDPAATGVQRWTATLEAAGDTNGGNDVAEALVAASAAADCGGLAPEILYAPEDAIDATGFVAVASGALGGPAWRLTGAGADLTTPPLAGGPARAELRVAWIASEAAAFDPAAIVEVSHDGGRTFAPIPTSSYRAAAPGGVPAEHIASLLAPSTSDLLVRWRVDEGEADSLLLEGLRVVACGGAATGRADVVAAEAFVQADAPGAVELAFDVVHVAGGTLDDVTVRVASELGVTLSGARVDGGWCTTSADGALLCTVPALSPGAVAELRLRAEASAAALTTVTATLSARAALTADAVRDAATTVRFGEASFGSRTSLSWTPTAARIADAAPIIAQLRIHRDGARGVDGGVLDIAAVAADVWLASSDPACAARGGRLQCTLAGDGADLAVDTIDVVAVVGVATGARRIVATWVGDGDPHDVASATLPIELSSDATLSLAFDPPATHPPAVVVTPVTLRVATTGASAPAVVGVRASDELVVRTATSDAAVCAIVEREVRCVLDALAADGTAEIILEVAPIDAGQQSLWAFVDATTDLAGPPARLTWRAQRDCEAHPCAASACTAVTCDTERGCLAVAASGTPCDDAMACGMTGVCVAGTCHRVGVDACDDGDACTTDRCDDTGTCTANAWNGPCEGACTVDGWCVDGVCAGGALRDCDDGDPCTVETCAEPDGCAYALIETPECLCRDLTPSTTCEDGAWVTRDGCGDVVDAEVCDDGDACTEDACVADVGCAFVPLDTPECASCVAACDGRECGPDPVCGASCGTCELGAVCAFGLCIDDPCDSLDEAGCCDGVVLSRCGGDGFEQRECGDEGCGYSAAEGRFACGGTDPVPGAVDPACPWLPRCISDGDCDDDDMCTTDRCSEGTCTHAPIIGCGDDTGPDAGPDAGADAGPDAGEDVGPVDAGDVGGDDVAPDSDAPADVDVDGAGDDVDAGAASVDPSGCGCTAAASGPGMIPAFIVLWLLRRGRRSARRDRHD